MEDKKFESVDTIREYVMGTDGAITNEQARHLLKVIDDLAKRVADKAEHSNVHYGKESFLGIDGYGPYSLRQVCKERWEIKLGHEKVTLFNRKGRRIRGEVNAPDKDWDGDW
jgi:hypothetical protein